TIKGWPFSRMFLAMPCPIRPRPMNPIRGFLAMREPSDINLVWQPTPPGALAARRDFRIYISCRMRKIAHPWPGSKSQASAAVKDKVLDRCRSRGMGGGMNRISKLYALATALGLVGSAGLLISGAGAAGGKWYPFPVEVWD